MYTLTFCEHNCIDLYQTSITFVTQIVLFMVNETIKFDVLGTKNILFPFS
jgi:hypothetical protein